MSEPELSDAHGLDPADWPQFRARAHRLLDAALNRMEGARDGPVWRVPDAALGAALDMPLPEQGQAPEMVDAMLARLMGFGVGNTHPRFFGWVHGSGTPSNILAEMAAAAMNANLGGRHHGAILVERQVVEWCRQLFGIPQTASGLIVSGTSLATLIALKAARDRAVGGARTRGLSKTRLVGYASVESHSCIARAFDILGLGSESLRRVPANADFEMDATALRAAIVRDRQAGHIPFALIGTAGTVNVGAIDNLSELADLAASERLWFHVDGAFGASAMLSERLRQCLQGIERADSLAFDFHKWLHVNYDAGMVLIRDQAAHRAAFALRPGYLEGAERGLAAGEPWPVDYGPELSRGFRALKVWAQLAEHGTAKLARQIERNCAQAKYLAARIDGEAELERLAPVPLSICCFRVVRAGLSESELDALNTQIVVRLQEEGTAAPSTTRIAGKLAIRVNITNHRTRTADLDLLVDAVLALADSV